MFVCYTVLSIPCSLVDACWERTDPLALSYIYVMFCCGFVTFPYGVLGQVHYLIVLITDLCLLSYFEPVMHTKYTSLVDLKMVLLVKVVNNKYLTKGLKSCRHFFRSNFLLEIS